MTLSVLLILLMALILYGIVTRCQLSRLRKKHVLLLHKAAETTSFLDTFTSNVTKSGDLSQWMNEIAQYAGDFIGAQAACIFRRNGEELTVVGVHGPFPSLSGRNGSDYVLTRAKYVLENLKRDKIIPGQGLIGKIAENGKEILIPNLALDPEYSELARLAGTVRSVMAVPLYTGSRISGVLCVVNNRDDADDAFSSRQFDRLREMAKRVALVMDITNVYSSLSEQERIAQELAFTRRLQLALMPETPRIEWGNFQVSALALSSKEVSGDYFDFVKLDPDRLLVVVGDASGKGLPACLIMAMTRTFISSCAGQFDSLKTLLAKLNEYLRLNTIGEKYITLGCCLLNRKDSSMEYACAGHTPLIMYTHQHLREIRPDGPVCGIFPEAEYETLHTQIMPDTTLLLYSDGINEALNSSDEEFGMDRLREAYRRSCERNRTPEEIVSDIKEAVNVFSGNPESLADDQTIIAIKYASAAQEEEKK